MLYQQNHAVLACFVDLTQARVTSGEGASFEELSLSEWPVGNAAGSSSWSMEGLAHSARGHPGQVGLDCIRKQAEQVAYYYLGVIR